MKHIVAAVVAAFMVFVSSVAMADIGGGGGGCKGGCPDPGGSTSNESGSSKNNTGAVVKVVACVLGEGILAVGKPVPLKKMTKRQMKRFQYEVKRHWKYSVVWAVACPTGGVVVAVAIIAADDFIARFVTGELPIKRTPRQEKFLFWRAGGEPYPDFSGPDPDLYGPR